MNGETWNWPRGATVAVSFTFDVDAEAGAIGEGDEYRRRLSTLSEARFGVTRGLPRILDLLHRYEVASTFFVPGLTAELHPDVVERILTGDHEIAHHGYLHLRSDKASDTEQREEIERGIDALEMHGAPAPSGYRSAAWELTPETFALLREHGFTYDSSCMGDDRPYCEEYGGHRIVELPVHWSLDDFPRFGWDIDSGGNTTHPGELYESWNAEYELARAEGRHITFTMHPEVIGRGQRFVQLERLIERIASDGDVWFAKLHDVAEHVTPKLNKAGTPA